MCSVLFAVRLVNIIIRCNLVNYASSKDSLLHPTGSLLRLPGDVLLLRVSHVFSVKMEKDSQLYPSGFLILLAFTRRCLIAAYLSCVFRRTALVS